MSSYQQKNEFDPVMNESPLEADFLRQYTANYRHLYACAVTVLGSPKDVCDVMQESCVVMWQKFEDFEPGTAFRKWACSIVFKVAKNHVRKQRHFNNGLTDELISRFIQIRTAEAELLELRREILRDCLKKLSIHDRDLLLQVYRDEAKSLIELSQQQKKTTSSLYSRLKRIRQMLSRCVQHRLQAGDD